MITRSDGLTDRDGRTMDALICACDLLLILESQHPDEAEHFLERICRCQDSLAIRIMFGAVTGEENKSCEVETELKEITKEMNKRLTGR